MILHTVDKLYSVNWFFSWLKKKIETRWTTGEVSRTYLRAQKYGFRRILEMRSGITTLSDLLRQKNQKRDWLTFFLSPNRTSSTYSLSEYHVEPNKMFQFEVHVYIYCENICWGNTLCGIHQHKRGKAVAASCPQVQAVARLSMYSQQEHVHIYTTFMYINK